MTDKSHITTTTVNFRDWILGTGEFSEENLKKARDEFFAKLGKHWSDLMLASLDKAFSDLDAVPEARAAIADTDERPPNVRCQQTGELRCAASRDGGGTGNTQEPVAWLILDPHGDAYEACVVPKGHVRILAEGFTQAPLYLHPQHTLTDAERTLIEKLTLESQHPKMGRSIWVMPQDRETAHGLLQRLK